MKSLLAAVVLACGMAIAGFGAAHALADPPIGGPPGKNPCEHGNAQKPCKEDPQPDHGADCEEHGKGGVNEDHCLDETTTTTTTTTTGPPGEERGLPAVFLACILDDGLYHVSATWDGLDATVTPTTIPGTKSGPTLVIVSQGGDSQGIIVNTAGTCVSNTTTTTTTTTTGSEPPATTTTGQTTTTPTSPGRDDSCSDDTRSDGVDPDGSGGAHHDESKESCESGSAHESGTPQSCHADRLEPAERTWRSGPAVSAGQDVQGRMRRAGQRVRSRTGATRARSGAPDGGLPSSGASCSGS